MMVFKEIESLIYYANSHLLLDELDIALTRNQILDELGIDDYIVSEVDYQAIEELECPCSLLEPIINYAVSKGKTKEENGEAFGNKLMSILSKKSSDLADIFVAQQKRNPIKATQWLYDYAIKSNYVNSCKIGINKHWEAKGTKHKIEVTINLAKPEFSVDQVKSNSSSNTGYPLCSICLENEGYAPSNKYNLRTVPLRLGKEEWFMQFSPYSYFNQHSIAINNNHTPMVINRDTLVKLFDFNDYLPHYFIGSNTELAGIGGSILNHEHFQGGYKLLPLFNAKDRRTFKSQAHPLVTISEVDWYNNCIRAASLDRHRLIDFGQEVIEKWKNYSDKKCGLQAKTYEQHHSMSLSVRRDKQDRYILEIILRSNIKSDQHPDGVFHAHKDKQNIKKEAIGLIEAMGLFVLPARLDKQLKEIEKYLTKEIKYSESKLSEDMQPHKDMIERLFKIQGTTKPTPLEASLNIKDEINSICEQILIDTAVFKQDKNGKDGLDRFFEHLGLVEKEVRS